MIGFEVLVAVSVGGGGWWWWCWWWGWNRASKGSWVLQIQNISLWVWRVVAALWVVRMLKMGCGYCCKKISVCGCWGLLKFFEWWNCLKRVVGIAAKQVQGFEVVRIVEVFWVVKVLKRGGYCRIGFSVPMC